MIKKIKSFFESRKTYRLVLQANDYQVIKPFLHGTQMENRRFGNYIFIKNSSTNRVALEKRNFQDFKESVTKHVNWELTDELFDIVAEQIQYNKKYNILITMVSEKHWETLNTSINIAQNTTEDPTTQRLIAINAFKELMPSK